MSVFTRLRGLVPSRGDGRPAAARIYIDLRDQIIHTVPGDHGIAPSEDAPRVWGVLLDIGLDNGNATVVGLGDGTSSLYTSGGGGIIGGGGREPVARASRQLVHLADAYLDGFPPAEALPLPGAGRSALVLLTYAGPRRLEDDSEALAEQQRGFASAVYMAAQDVLTQLRLAEESRAQA